MAKRCDPSLHLESRPDVVRPQVTLMDWGNAIVRSKKVVDGTVVSIQADLHLAGDFKKTKKKITWLSATSPDLLQDVVLLDYDYLINKKKIEDDDNVDDFITPVTEFVQHGFADANVRALPKGEIIQFERRGYFIVGASALAARSCRRR